MVLDKAAADAAVRSNLSDAAHYLHRELLPAAVPGLQSACGAGAGIHRAAADVADCAGSVAMGLEANVKHLGRFPA